MSGFQVPVLSLCLCFLFAACSSGVAVPDKLDGGTGQQDLQGEASMTWDTSPLGDTSVDTQQPADMLIFPDSPPLTPDTTAWVDSAPPAPDTWLPRTDSYVWPDMQGPPDLWPSPDTTPSPDAGELPDTMPPVNNDLCETPHSLVLVNGMATASDTTATATNGIDLPDTGCTGYATPGPDRYYAINLDGGKLYEVTLTPQASFDPALYAFTDCFSADATCEPGMGSDRLGDGVVERVLLAPQGPSAFIIGVDSFSSSSAGSYTLTVKEFSGPLSNNTCPTAQQLQFTLGQASASGNTNGATNNVDLPASGCVGFATPGPDLFYTIFLEQDKAYLIQLEPESSFDPALAVFSSCSDIDGTCEPGMGSDRIGNGVPEWIVLAPDSSGAFTIMVDSFLSSAAGSFLLTISEIATPAPNNTCASAQQMSFIGAKATAIGDTRTADNQVALTSAGCTGYTTPGPDLFYSIEVETGKVYTVTLTPASTYDAALYVFSDCADPEGTCGDGLGSDSGLSGAVEEVSLNVISGGTMLIGVDAFFGTGAGTFKLVVEEVGVYTCGPSNCSGCCYNNTCMSGTADSACGLGGIPCQTCGTGRTCSTTGSCILDSQAKWRIVVYEGTVSATDANGDLWDSSGIWEEPDPYVELTLAGQVSTTSTVQDSLTPLWNESLFEVAANQILAGFKMEVLDDDPFLATDTIGTCSVSVSESELLAGTKTVICGLSNITLQFFAL